jgi:hypothetical protein
VVEARKQAVSIRMNAADIRKVKRLAMRLGVRDSDVIRFAVKSTLTRLGPLYDPEVQGRNLVPVFVEWGNELLRFFDLDAARLDAIINEGTEPGSRVDREDIALLALTASQEPYAALQLRALDRGEHLGQTQAELSESLRRYLYSKYLYGSNEVAPGLEQRRERLRLAGNGTDLQKVAAEG